MNEMIVIRPQEKQEKFLRSAADIAIYGGGAGGGKTWALLLEPLRHLDNADFGAVIFRRTMPEITKEKGMWDESAGLYALFGGRPNLNQYRWTFPSGMRVSFAHLQYESSLADWRGAQIALIGYDQLETFTEQQFFYMLSRNRSTSGVKPYIRATCNPEPGWLANFLSWWIGPDGYALPERAGLLRWFIRQGDRLIWADSRHALHTEYGVDCHPKSVTFIPASVHDNPILLEKDPGYLGNLNNLPLVDRERLLGGNWRVKPSAGKVFNRAWFGLVDAVPAGGVTCIFWDFAATEKSVSSPDPDFTAAVTMRRVDGRWYVLDCYAEQLGPGRVEQVFENYSRQIAAQAREQGSQFMARWEKEPASAGKREAARLAALLAGLDARGIPAQGDKVARAKGLSAQAEAGNVSLLTASWNIEWLEHMHGQPDMPHDDIMDASSGAFNELTGLGQVAYAPSIWD